MTDLHIHDTGYKFLFSHSELVQQLMEGFAPDGLAELLDFTTLTRVNGSFVTPAMKSREDDIIWSVQMGEARLYLYILLEFQSSIDAAMPVRMMQYVAALYDHLIRENVVKPQNGLPAVLPIVLYNGDDRWQVTTNIRNLIHSCPTVLLPYQPQLTYYLLDEGAYSDHQLAEVKNAVSAIFSFENAGTIETAKIAIRRMVTAVNQLPDKQRLDRIISIWVKRHLQRKLPQSIIPETEHLLEDSSMLERNIERWYEQAHSQGMQQGMQQGQSVLLAQMLAAKFANANQNEYIAKLHNASEADLIRYSLQLLSAQTIEEVFNNSH